METKRSSRIWIRVVSLVGLAVLAAAYVAGYFYAGTVADSARLAESREWEDGTARWIEMRHRTFKHAWQSVLFSPAAAVESLVVGKEVHAVYSESR